MTPRRHPIRISKKSAESALASLLYGCTPARLASFTTASLAGSYNVPVAKVEQMLERARSGRGL